MAPAGSHTHKVQVADGLLLVNHEQFRGGDPYSAGMAVYDLADPFDPQQVGWFDSTGKGVHRIVWTGGRLRLRLGDPRGHDDRIWVVVDMRDPRNPVEAGRWWWPGQLRGRANATWPEGKRFAAHHALVDGDRAYLGYGDAGLVVLDISDVAKPTQLANLTWEHVRRHPHLPAAAGPRPARRHRRGRDRGPRRRAARHPGRRRRRPGRPAGGVACARRRRTSSTTTGCASARTTCTRTGPAPTAAPRWSSATYFNARAAGLRPARRTSTRSRSRTGCRRLRRARRPRRSTTSSSAPATTSG